VVPNPAVAELGLPLDERGRIDVDETLRVQGRDDVWALGDCAAVPNAATPTRTDPPTCQHALRQARHLAKSLSGSSATYRYASLGEGATLGRDKGIALVLGVQLRGWLAATVIRWYHLRQVPLMSRRLRILADGTISALFRRDIAELGTIEPRRADA
jgi:NADH dehydrogenase